MLRYVLLIGLLLTSSAACTSPVAQTQTTAAQEIHEDEPVHEQEHNDEEEDEPGCLLLQEARFRRHLDPLPPNGRGAQLPGLQAGPPTAPICPVYPGAMWSRP